MIRLKTFMMLCLVCCITFSFAQNSKVAEEVSLRKSEGLSLTTADLFTTDKTMMQKSPLDRLVKNAVYLQLDPQKLANTRQASPEGLQLQLPAANGKTLSLELVQHDVLTPDFFVETSLSNGEAVDYTPGIYYRGHVAGNPNTLAAISIFDGEISGVISTSTEGKMVLTKLGGSKLNKGVATDYAFYREADMTVQNDFACGAIENDNYGQRVIKYLNDFEINSKMLDASNCVRVYFEANYQLYQEKGSDVTTVSNWVSAMYNVVSTLYQNENINTTISQLYVWETQDSYSNTSSSDALNAFRSARPIGSWNGDLAHLIARSNAGGGIAWVDALCSSYRYAYSGINSNFSQLPSYSWTVDVVAHEMGHNLGSPHTHSCSWPGGAIDDCYTVEGSCSPGPTPTAGTIMSYCHLSSVGKDLMLGFGPLPGDLIRDRVYNASCLTACNTGTPTCDDGLQNGDETGVDCGGAVCDACPTCDDGIQNGNETGVDCGGANCAPCPCLDNEITFTITIDNYGNEFSWEINDANGSVVANSPAIYGANTTTVENVCLPDGCYDLVVNDSYGDGICCSYGIGSYTLADSDGTVLATGGEFTDTETHNFCISDNPAPTCTDGVQNGNESGVDCGGDCAACPTCDDGVQNGNETGVDCGGDCVACPTCTDGIQNGDETGVDCGGADCAPCATCSDGIQNGTETGVDCGGDCIACATCTDGILNGNEEGVDCGGPDCAPCFTCNDGVLNGNETGVDCGGADCAPCASCTDGIQNGTETGVDCGGDCDACVTCEDGVQNGNETGIDCGGDCTPCATCDDGIQNGNETGVDCGGDCVDCATCEDGVKNGDETGIDCGGADCPSCATCDDGIMNGHETSIDCGGPDCAPCITCDDGIQNGNETGVDCGGDCPACPIPGCTDETAHNYNPNADTDDGTCETCTDGVLNGDETSVDCGGSLCDACPVFGCTDEMAHNYDPNADVDDSSCETCDDGELNGDETAVDCGGALCPACPVLGCTDQTAHNFDPNADTDDGSCETCTDGELNGDETGVDCGGVLCAPCNTGCSYELIDFNNFDASWGIWNDGGSDCRRSANDAAYANSGNYCARLRDNTSTSTMTTDNMNLAAYEELTVDFSYLARSMENTEDFWLQVSLDGGSTYTTVEEWNRGDEFENNIREAGSAVISGPFTSTTRLRFRADASGNSDWVYIDDVAIEGCLNPSLIETEPTPSAQIAAEMPSNLPVAEEAVIVTDFNLFPNPAKDYVTVAFSLTAETETLVSITSITGQVIEVRDLGAISGAQTLRFDASQYVPGYYFVSLKTKAGIESNKFVIVR